MLTVRRSHGTESMQNAASLRSGTKGVGGNGEAHMCPAAADVDGDSHTSVTEDSALHEE
jgi:hypothetical protein